MGNDEATSRSFFADSLDPGSRTGRICRTGDIVTASADGCLDYVGRADRQVKVAGVRMELGEIELVLANHPAIVACAVTVSDRSGTSPNDVGGSELVAHFVANADVEPSMLRAFVGGMLPAAMVPRHWVRRESLPTTAHGKTDYRSLEQGPQ